MAGWWDSSTLFFEVSFTPPWDTPSWTDLTDRLRPPVRYRRGKDDEDADFAPGELTVTLAHPDRYLDPDYAAGPYFGQLLPMRRCRLRAALGAFSVTVFTGFITSWGQQWGPFDGNATITAVDSQRLARNNPLPNSAYEAAVLNDSPTHYFPLQTDLTDIGSEANGAASAYADGSWGFTTAAPLPLGQAGALTLSTLSASFQSATLGTGGNYARTVEFWASLGDAGAGIEVEYYGYNDMTCGVLSYFTGVGYNDEVDTGLIIAGVGYSIGLENINNGWHHWAFTVSGSSMLIMRDGEQIASTPLVAGAPGLFGGNALRFNMYLAASVAHIAIWDTPLTSTQIRDHYTAGLLAHGGNAYGELGGARIAHAADDIGWPAADRNLSTGGTIQGPYLPDGQDFLEYVRKVERSEHGLVFIDRDGKLTFRDRNWLFTSADSGVILSDDGAGGAIEYVAGDPVGNDIDTIRNVVTVSWRQGAITRRDTTSSDEYGASDDPHIDAPTINTADAASNLAAFILRTQADPGHRFPAVEIDLRPNAAVQFPAVLGLEVGSVVTIERTPMNVGSQIVRKAQILGLEGEITEENWTVWLYLSPPLATNTTAPYLTLGHATLGKIGAAAGNLIPF